MYPLAVTVLIPRFALFLAGVALHVFLHKILLIGTDLGKPLPPIQRMISKMLNKFGSALCLLSVGIIPIIKHVDVDYTKWLGPDYKNQPFPKKYRTPTYVSNHIGWSDGCLYFWALHGDIAFLAGDFVKNIPLVGYIVSATEGIFCPRGGTTEAKQ